MRNLTAVHKTYSRRHYLRPAVLFRLEYDRHADQARSSSRLHFLQNVRAVGFDGAKADPQPACDDLVRFARGDELEHLSLPPRQQRRTGLNFIELQVLLARYLSSFAGLSQALDQRIVPQRFLDKIESARPERRNSARHRGVCRNEDRWDQPFAAVDLLLQLKARHVRH